MKRVLVTGAGTGLGKAIAIELCKNDFEVVLHYRSSKSGIEDALSRINELGKKATSLCFDITDRAQCKQILSKMARTLVLFAMQASLKMLHFL